MLPRSDFEALGLLQSNANELLQSASVQEALASHRHEKWVHEISEASLTMLDLCGTTKDVVLQMKSHMVFSPVSNDEKSRRWSVRSMLLCGQGQGKFMLEEVAMEAGDQRVELEPVEKATSELESTFRHLIQTRVLLLNIVTSS